MGNIDPFVYQGMADLNRLEDVPLITQYEPNAGGQDIFHRSLKHQRVLSGANNSGKTYGGIMEDAFHIIPELTVLGEETGYTIHPYNRIRIDPTDGILGWISSYSQDVQIDTIQPVFDKVFAQYIGKIYAEEGVYHWFSSKRGDRINFKWQTQGWQSYRGPKLDFIHMDEPHAEGIYNECVARLFDKMGYLWMTMTPIVDVGASPARIRDVIWMVKKIVEPYFRNKDKFPELEIVFVDLEENKAYINTQFVRNMLAHVDENEYIIRTTGKFIIMIGISAFSERRLDKLQFYQGEHPGECIPEYGYLHYETEGSIDNEDVYFDKLDVDDWPEEPDEGFIFRIWEHPVAEQLGIRPMYHIGADLAEGKRDGDYTAAYVKRQDNGQVVASLHGRMDEEEAARQLNLLGRYYRNGDGHLAKLAMEVNNTGKTAMAYLLNGHSDLMIKKYDVVSLYQRPSLANLMMGLHIPGPEYGWYTTNRHRDLLLGAMRRSLLLSVNSTEKKGPCLMPDSGWTSEARVFVKNSRGKYEAAEGFYDDRIIASAIADMSIEQGVFETPIYRSQEAKIQEPESAFLDDPKDPKGETTILNMAELRRRAIERKNEEKLGKLKAVGDDFHL
jgi:hypothetical protein